MVYWEIWKTRDLTYTGKILILKTFELSQINFELEMRGMPNTIKKRSSNNYVQISVERKKKRL